MKLSKAGKLHVQVQTFPHNYYNSAKQSYKEQMTVLRKRWATEFAAEKLARAKADEEMRIKESKRVAAYRREKEMMLEVNRKLMSAETELVERERYSIHEKARKHRDQKDAKKKKKQVLQLRKQAEEADSYLVDDTETIDAIKKVARQEKVCELS
ncbi:hypothetical protein SARC_03364 [Sphaeroforma arctica JP610]|uniref:Uncharacterized protein n=1 Tax=Sphaeroforma arctica JP610 TaxID=667725 RepID=A0A0L0G5U5_9EUKA|nr:hypothetical protein SARC_03364 [Sphaeroforma arctica JP610]KNC84402.1 hypothetical protein SARC_03364 [Sphaeroforma arctica JP610]|eukprot:XP_014158304.1 hypothetical protein SARC_03364 [Sphaeroforma arctica JP610]